jgi:hypothetical protein
MQFPHQTEAHEQRTEITTPHHSGIVFRWVAYPAALEV